jgi:hypothetical protein
MEQKPLNDLHASSVKQMAALEGWLEPLFAKAPHIPANAREMLVKIAPWLALIFGVLGLVGIVSAGMLTSMLFSMAWIGGGAAQIALAVALIAGLLASILQLLAYSPLTAHKKQGWNYLFYGSVLSAIASLVDIIFGYGSLGSIIGALIGFWLLFEIRGYYKA